MDTLTPLFDWVLATSGRASLLTVVVLMVQAVLRHRVPARWRYALWLPVLVVLLMPAFPESSWSVTSITHMVSAPLPELSITGQGAASPSKASLAPATETPVPIPWRKIMSVAWLGGAAGMILFGIVAFARTLWRFKRSRLPVSDALQREFAVLAREIGLSHVPRVWVSSTIRSPAVTGLLRPTLLLPAHFEQSLAPHEAHLVLKHELMHIKRGDLLVNALLCQLLALHWFNPVLWLAFFKARLDREAACDAQVLDGDNQAQRVAYGHTLLKIETAFSHRGLSLGFVGIFQRGAALRARIQSIASQPKPHPLVKAALSVSIALLTFLGITKAANPDPNAPKVYLVSKFVEISERTPKSSDGAPLPAPLDAATGEPGLLGILTDPQFQVVIRNLSQRKGVDLMSPPSLTTRSGQQAEIEVFREFTYTDEAGKQVTRNLGTMLAVLPNVTAEGPIALDVSPRVVEFMGFAGLKGGGEVPISAKEVFHPDGTTSEAVSDVEKVEARAATFYGRVIESVGALSKAGKKPIFRERKAKAKVLMTSGETIVLEVEPRMDEQIVEEVDEKDNVISSKIDIFHRRMIVFVTAYVIDPAGDK
jgi:beta-lactamase regulating signal transducer with metallopeptidase domain